MAFYTVVVCFPSDSGMVAIAEHCGNESFTEFRQIAISSFHSRQPSESSEIFWDNNLLIGICGFSSFGFLSIFPVQTTQMGLHCWLQAIRDSVVTALNVFIQQNEPIPFRIAQSLHETAQGAINDVIASFLMRTSENNNFFSVASTISPRADQINTVPINLSLNRHQMLFSPYDSNEGMNDELFDPFDIASTTSDMSLTNMANNYAPSLDPQPNHLLTDDNSTNTSTLSHPTHRRSFSNPIQPISIQPTTTAESDDATSHDGNASLPESVINERPALQSSLSLPILALDAFGFPITNKQQPVHVVRINTNAVNKDKDLIRLESLSPVAWGQEACNSPLAATVSSSSSSAQQQQQACLQQAHEPVIDDSTTDKAAKGGKGVALLLELDYSGMSDFGVIDAESLLSKMDKQLKTAIDSQIKIVLTKDDVYTVFHVFHDAFVDLLLPPALSISNEQAVKDARRESICLNGEMYQGNVEDLKLAMHSLLLPLVVDGNNDLLDSLCLDILRAASRTASGGDSYAIADFLFRKSLTASGDPCWIVTPAGTESKPIRIDINGEAGCVTIWSENCFLLRLSESITEGVMPHATGSTDFLSRFRKKSSSSSTHKPSADTDNCTPSSKDGILIVTQLTASVSIIDGSRMRFLCMTCPIVENCPLSYASLGSGTRICNGRYDLLGFRNGSPWYVNGNGVHISKEYLNGALWIMGRPPQSFYGIRSDALIPPLAGWVRCENSTSLPAPYLTILSHNPLLSSPGRSGYSIRSNVDPFRSQPGDESDSPVGQRYDKSPLARSCKLCGLRLRFSGASSSLPSGGPKSGEQLKFLDIINSQSALPVKSGDMDFLLPSSPRSPDSTPLHTRLNSSGKPVRVIKHVATLEDGTAVEAVDESEHQESASQTTGIGHERPSEEQPKAAVPTSVTKPPVEPPVATVSDPVSNDVPSTPSQTTPKKSLWSWRKNDSEQRPADSSRSSSSKFGGLFNGRNKSTSQAVPLSQQQAADDNALSSSDDRVSGDFQFSIAAQVVLQEKEAQRMLQEPPEPTPASQPSSSSGNETKATASRSSKKFFRLF